MSELIKISTRNILRNWRRSVLTILTTFLAAMLLIISNSYTKGMFNNILDENTRLSGHLRITGQDYDIKKRLLSLDCHVPNYREWKKALLENKKVAQVVGRIKYGALIFKGEEHKEGAGYGIEEDDFAILALNEALLSGRLPEMDKEELILGKDLAADLALTLGDEVTVLTRTLYNSTWALNFQVVGIFDLKNSSMNKVFIAPITVGQALLDMEDSVTELLVFCKQRKESELLLPDLQRMLYEQGLIIRKWDEIGFAPVFINVVTLVMGIIEIIFLLLAALGIINTMLMAVYERKAEIGLLKSLGMKQGEILLIFTIEGFFLGLCGTILGLLLGGGGVYLLATKGVDLGTMAEDMPIMVSSVIYGSYNWSIFVRSVVLCLSTTVVASFIPALNAVRLQVSDAIRQ